MRALDVTPNILFQPDSVTLEESRAFFEAHGYAVHTFECQRMMLLTPYIAPSCCAQLSVQILQARP
jgi:hypothetical protein